MSQFLDRLPQSPRLSHRLWLERPWFFSFIHRRWLVALIVVLVYGTGLLVAVVFSTPTAYVKSPVFALGAAGVAWVYGSIRIRTRVVDTIYADLYEVFLIEQNLFYDHVRCHFDAICKKRNQFFLSLILGIVMITSSWISFYHYPLYFGDLMQPSVRPWAFDPSVYETSNRITYFCIVSCFNLLVSLMVGSSVWLIFRELVLVRSLTLFPVVPLANAVRARLKPLADFHIRVAVDWALGALSIFTLFYRTPDIISVTILGLLVFVGFAVLIIPQFLLASIVRQAYEKSCRLALKDYRDLSRMDSSATQKADYLSQITAITHPPRFWVYSADELMRWFATQVIAITALYVQISRLK